MTTLLEIKPIIHDFIQENLDESFGDKIYWIGERVEEPLYPYCMLTELTENKDKRTSHHQGDLKTISLSGSGEYEIKREAITTRYKTAVITVGVYNAFVTNSYDDMDMDEAKEFAYEEIDRLEGEFENYPINSKFSVQNISPIRALHEPVSGGYMYRYEFDLTIGYNEPVVKEKDYGQSVNVSGDINFTVTIDGSDNIIIDT